MRDPYGVLGVSPSASEEEIKKAYRALVKKYHPDRYVNSPMERQAQEKLKEINTAYDQIEKIRSGEAPYESFGGGGGFGGDPFSWGGRRDHTGGQTGNRAGNAAHSGGHSSSNDPDTAARLRDIREMIERGLIPQAETALDGMSNRPAEWYFLRGIVHFRRAQYDHAQQCYETAADMDPQNAEYRNAADRMGQAYERRARQEYGPMGTINCGRGGATGQLCQCVACMVLMNMGRCCC